MSHIPAPEPVESQPQSCPVPCRRARHPAVPWAKKAPHNTRHKGNSSTTMQFMAYNLSGPGFEPRIQPNRGQHRTIQDSARCQAQIHPLTTSQILFRPTCSRHSLRRRVLTPAYRRSKFRARLPEGQRAACLPLHRSSTPRSPLKRLMGKCSITSSNHLHLDNKSIPDKDPVRRWHTTRATRSRNRPTRNRPAILGRCRWHRWEVRAQRSTWIRWQQRSSTHRPP